MNNGEFYCYECSYEHKYGTSGHKLGKTMPCGDETKWTYQQPKLDKVSYPGSYNTYKAPTEDMQNKIDILVLALGMMVSTVVKHKLDIEDEAYEEITMELNAITAGVINQL